MLPVAAPDPAGVLKAQSTGQGFTWTSTGSSVWASSVSRSSMVMITCPLRWRNITWGGGGRAA